jgi:hypothetical protein
MSAVQAIITTLNSINCINFHQQSKKERLRKFILSIAADKKKVTFNTTGATVYLENLTEKELSELHSYIDSSST